MTLHASEEKTEIKLNFSLEDDGFDFIRPQASRGVYRALFPVDRGDLSEQDVNMIIRNAIERLAHESKRATLAPKLMADGIAIDWVYDLSIRNQDLDDVIRMLPQDDTKAILTPIFRAEACGSGRHLDDPIIVDVDEGTELSRANQHFRAVSDDTPLDRGSLKRKSTSPDNQLTLRNLSSDMDVGALQGFLVGHGIPLDAILSIRLRSVGKSTTATVDITDDYASTDLKRTLPWDVVACCRSSRNSTPATSSSTSSAPQHPSTRWDGSHLNIVAESDRRHGVIDASDTEVYETDVLGTQVPVEESHHMEHHSVSPALSYLTIEGSGADISLLLPKGEPTDDGIQAYDPYMASSDSSDSESHVSDSDSDSDSDQQELPVSQHPPQTPSEDLAERLLHGPIDVVDDYLAQEVVLRDAHRWSAAASLPTGSTASHARRDKNDHHTNPASRRQHTTTHKSSTRRVMRVTQPPESHNPRSAALEPSDSSDTHGNLTIHVPKASHAKGRRLLVSSNKTALVTAVYMRGDLQFIDQMKRVRISRFSLPVHEEHRTSIRHVVDAVRLTQDLAVVGYNEGRTQVSCITMDQDTRPNRHDLLHRAHNVVHEHRRTGTSSLNRGISSMCLFNERSLQFLSGGEDGAVHLWTISDAMGKLSATSAQLATRYTQPIQCIAHRASDHRVFTCYSQYIHSVDFEVGMSASSSNSKSSSDGVFLSSKPQQLHIHPQNPAVVILEVDHRDKQVQVYDTRKSNFRAAPCIEFGYQTVRSHESTRRVYRFFKGSTIHSLFARGYQNGVACVWDYRKPQAILERFHQQRADPIEHAVLQDSETLLAYGGHTVTFWNINNT